jgi:hypothetical protein
MLLVCNFVIPFFGLLSRHIKRSKKALACWAVYLLLCRYLDLYWLIFPKDDGVVPLGIVDVLVWIGVVGIFFGTAARRVRGVTLVPLKDPRLKQSLAFDNY